MVDVTSHSIRAPSGKFGQHLSEHWQPKNEDKNLIKSSDQFKVRLHLRISRAISY
jgi:hypothetical protein